MGTFDLDKEDEQFDDMRDDRQGQHPQDRNTVINPPRLPPRKPMFDLDSFKNAGGVNGSNMRPSYKKALKQASRFPDLIRVIRDSWHQGKPSRNPENGEMDRMPWRMLELIDKDSSQPIDTWEVDSRTNSNDLAAQIEDKIYERTAGCGDGMLHVYEVHCFFGSEDGRTGKEIWTGNLNLPMETPRYGNNRMNWGNFREASKTETQLAVRLRDSTEATQIAMNIVRESTQAMLENMREMRAQIQNYQTREVEFIKLREAMEDRSVEREVERQKAKIWMDTVGVLTDRVSKILPVVGYKLMQTKKGGSPREQKALQLLNAIFERAQKMGVRDAEGLTKFLAMMGIDPDEQIAQDAMEMVTEFAIEEMGKKAEAEAKGLAGALGGAPAAAVNKVLAEKTSGPFIGSDGNGGAL